MTDEELDEVPLADLLAAVARRKEHVPYETEAELLAAEATGWVAIAILKEKGTRRNARYFASVFGPYGHRHVAAEATEVIRRNHAYAARKGRTQTILVRTEVKPSWKEPS